MHLGCELPMDEAGPQTQIESRREPDMRDFLMKQYVKAQIFREDHGQDLIEYALTAALIALAATAGMDKVANGINTAFSNIGSKLTSYTT
jgi:Flp pilus assembly pilin Flp